MNQLPTQTDAWGIVDSFQNASGEWMPTPAESRRAVLAAMGEDPDDPRPPPPSPVRVVRQGEALDLGDTGELSLEGGGVRRINGRLPDDVPLGYHDFRPDRGDRAVRVIVTPAACRLPSSPRIWGWATQLYAVRSARSWGIGDLGDLRRLARWSARELGAGMLLVNPLHAALPIVPQQSSPYYPSSRRYRNPLYLRVEDVPGAETIGPDLERLAVAGRALNARRRIDRDRVFSLKLGALEMLWRRVGADERDERLERYRREQGGALREYAVFCVLAEHHRAGWRVWPEEHRRPDAPAVARFADAHADRVRFHEWLQWLFDEQLARASELLPVMQDLPIGVDPAGADAWAWQDVLATDVAVGAPPDRYIKDGQDWGLPPFVPHRLRAAAYEPFVQTIRATLRNAGALRIDHVMGLFRLFWVPWGRRPVDGVYVRYPADDLLGIVALESARANAFVVGEDLGTVEEGVREQLADRCILSYRLLWFEPEPPARYPRLALSAVTTHDLPTIAGLWSGADVRHQREIGLSPNEGGLAEMRDRLRRFTGVANDAPASVVIEKAHRVLASAPSIIVSATLDDALATEERPNMPGTMNEWPNWSLALPAPLEELEQAALPRAVAAALRIRDSAPERQPCVPDNSGRDSAAP
ncbi:MAG TPA: 4-alpha-glucanotransferase [Methylomirabilota bacterium]